MPALSFRPQFIEPIRARTKNHTIRAAIPRGYTPGLWVPLYSALRTVHTQLIGSGLCANPVEVRLDFDNEPAVSLESGAFAAIMGERPAGLSGADVFAIRDGFTSWAEMEAFWGVHHPGVRQFTGWLLPWTDFTTDHRLGAWAP